MGRDLTMTARFMDMDVDTSYPFFALFHPRICPLFSFVLIFDFSVFVGLYIDLLLFRANLPINILETYFFHLL